MSVDETIEKIVDTRGYLHHHTYKRKDMWHPDSQERFAVDALFLYSVTFTLCFEMATEFLYDDSVVEKYNALVDSENLGS